MSDHPAFRDFATWIFAEMNRADVYVEVPPPPPEDVQFVWTKRERPPFDKGEHWRRWRRMGRDGFWADRWSDSPGFSHTWGSLCVHYRQITTTDPEATR